MTITNPKYLDGIEVYNANPRHISRNEISKLWAEQYHLLTVGGSDYHKYDDLGHGGICLNEKAESIHDIVKHLKIKLLKLSLGNWNGNFNIIFLIPLIPLEQ